MSKASAIIFLNRIKEILEYNSYYSVDQLICNNLAKAHPCDSISYDIDLCRHYIQIIKDKGFIFTDGMWVNRKRHGKHQEYTVMPCIKNRRVI